MPKLTILTISFFFISILNINAQFGINIFDTLWDSIPTNDLKMSVYKPDTSASAVVLSDNGCLILGIEQSSFNLRVFHQVKILKKSAFEEYGKHSILIHNYETIKNIRAQTINPDGTKVAVNEFFDEKLNEYVTLKKFVFPKLQEGSIVEYEYTMESENIFELSPWYFQSEIPVRHSELLLTIPPSFNYIFLQKGERKIKQDKIEIKRKIKIDKNFINLVDSFYRFQIDTIDAIKSEGYITTMSDYIIGLKFQLSEYGNIYSPHTPKKVLTDWKSLSQEFLDEKALGQQITKKGKYNDIWKTVKSLVENTAFKEEKIRILYEYINKNVDWIDDDFNIYVQTTLENAFKNKRANSGELNMMLIACLNEAGIKAYPMLISTREHGQVYKQYPIRNQFNHLICYVKDGDKSLFLDAGNIYRPITCPRISSLNGAGFVLDTKNPRWIDIVAPLSSQTVLVNCKLNSEGVLSGYVNESHIGYSAVNERTNLKGDSKNSNLKKAWSNIFPDFQINTLEIFKKDSSDQPFKRNFTFTVADAATIEADLIYIKPTLKTNYDKNLFKQKSRNYPIDMPYPIKDNYVLNLTIPEDFMIETTPKDVKINLPKSGGSYIYSCTTKDNQIQLNVRVEIKQLHYTKEEYSNVKHFFDMIVAKQDQQIVLKKKKK
jgi:Domain of Unknown Function with PDB structure (DUF3857)